MVGPFLCLSRLAGQSVSKDEPASAGWQSHRNAYHQNAIDQGRMAQRRLHML